MTERATTPSPALSALAVSSEASRSERPRIYVACLAAYNNGCLHGRWIDATTPDEIRREVSAMLRASPESDPEESAIHDYEGFGGAAVFACIVFKRGARLFKVIAVVLVNARSEFAMLADEFGKLAHGLEGRVLRKVGAAEAFIIVDGQFF